MNESDLNSIRCVSWDFELEDGVGDWSSEGCEYKEFQNNIVTCDCNHATNFAVLMVCPT